MRQLDVLLVHPDPLLRQRLRRALHTVDFLRVMGEAVYLEEAWRLIRAVPYGVVFLGVHLGENNESDPSDESGMELARRIMQQKHQNHQAAVVFLADNEESTPNAFEAFDLGATDYLVFPCNQDRFNRTLMRLKQFRTNFRLAPQQSFSQPKQDFTPQDHTHQHIQTPQTENLNQTLQLPLAPDEQDDFTTALKKAWNTEPKTNSAELNKLSIALGGRTLLLPYDDITFIEADEDYSHVHSADDKFLTSYRLKNLEDRLRPHGFFRVHRKYLVNLQMVTELVSVSGGNCLLRTAGRTRIELPISRRRLSELKQALGL